METIGDETGARLLRVARSAIQLVGSSQTADRLGLVVHPHVEEAQSGFQAKKLVLKARQYADQGDLDNAQLAYQQAAAVEPRNAMAHAELGLFYMRMNNKPEAIRSLRRAYKLNPGAPGVFAALIDLGAAPQYPGD